MKNKKLNKNIIIFFIFGGIYLIIRELYCFILYFYNIAISRGDKVFLTSFTDLSNEAKLIQSEFKDGGKEIENFILGNYSGEEYINSFDNIRLFTRKFLNGNSDKWVIVLHGYGASSEFMYFAGKKFFDKGYNVLIPDCRGHGKSGGSYIGFGWHDRLDLLCWIKHIIEENKNAKIVLYGVSMGGATVMMTSGEKLPKNIVAIVEDCGYTSMYDVFLHQIKRMYKISFKPFIFITSLFCKVKCGYSFKDASSIRQLRKCEKPILFIHGDLDDFVPYEMMDKLFESVNPKCPKDKLIIKGAKHGVSAMVGKNVYWNKIFRFLENYI